jgi:hypothetical protein
MKKKAHPRMGFLRFWNKGQIHLPFIPRTQKIDAEHLSFLLKQHLTTTDRRRQSLVNNKGA